MYTLFDRQEQSWFAHGMKAGREAAQKHPEWTDSTLYVQSGMVASKYLLSDPEGASEFSRGFERGYKASR
jgi:hypothetical protein